MTDSTDTRIVDTRLLIHLRTNDFIATSVCIYRLSVECQCVKSCIGKGILVWPDGTWLTTCCLTLTGIDDINLLYFAIIIPVVLTEVYLPLNSIAGINNHLWCIRIIHISCSLTIKLMRMLELYGSYDIESEVELTITLVEEIVVNTTDSTVIIGISHLVEHVLIECLDIFLTWFERQHILWVFESHIFELNQDDESFLFSLPCHSQSFSERLRIDMYLMLFLQLSYLLNGCCNELFLSLSQCLVMG